MKSLKPVVVVATNFGRNVADGDFDENMTVLLVDLGVLATHFNTGLPDSEPRIPINLTVPSGPRQLLPPSALLAAERDLRSKADRRADQRAPYRPPLGMWESEPRGEGFRLWSGSGRPGQMSKL